MYNALSALLYNSLNFFPFCGAIEIPTEQLTDFEILSKKIGVEIVSHICFAFVFMNSTDGTFERKTENSSPPNRLIISESLKIFFNLFDISQITVSPARCPYTSLICLKLSPQALRNP